MVEEDNRPIFWSNDNLETLSEMGDYHGATICLSIKTTSGCQVPI